MKNYEDMTRDSITAPPTPLSQPHFDEESTVVSARQVVPLAEVEDFDPTAELGVAETRRRVGALVVSVVLAAVLGGMTALILYSRRTAVSPTNPAPAVATEQLQPTPEQSAAAEAPTETEEPEPETIATNASETSAEDEVTEPELKPKTTVRPKPNVTKREEPVVTAKTDQSYRGWEETRRRRVEAQREEMIEERRQQRREYRREARRQRRERWRDGDGSADDLFRIREIFEGPRP